MKIVDNRKKANRKCFDDVQIGETFCLNNDPRIFMKTTKTYLEDEDFDVNAVSLGSGKVAFIPACASVIPLSCECVVADQ